MTPADPRPTAVNLLTPDVVKEASREIQTGRHVQLDWPLESIKHPGFARVPLKHRLLDNYVSLKEYALDDELEFNTQGGSQWDSLKHVSEPPFSEPQIPEWYQCLMWCFHSTRTKRNRSTIMAWLSKRPRSP